MLFQKENCDVLSGLRPRLLQDRWGAKNAKKGLNTQTRQRKKGKEKGKHSNQGTEKRAKTQAREGRNAKMSKN